MQKYKFSVDSTFLIGSAHVNSGSPCQDYAHVKISETSDTAYIALSDGCSSGGLTDVGARILVHRYLNQAHREYLLGRENSLSLTKRDLNYLGLKLEDMLATLVTIAADQSRIIIRLHGDGVIVLLRKDGTRSIHYLDWADNTPAYPIYFSNLGRAVSMPERFWNHHKSSDIPTYDNSAVFDKSQDQYAHLVFNGSDRIVGEYGYYSLYGTQDLAGVAIFSDGVSQVVNRHTGEKIPVSEVVDSCLAFKNTTGSFLKRRVRKQMADWKRDSFEPVDDFSCAVLLIEEVETDDVVEEVTDGN